MWLNFYRFIFKYQPIQIHYKPKGQSIECKRIDTDEKVSSEMVDKEGHADMNRPITIDFFENIQLETVLPTEKNLR